MLIKMWSDSYSHTLLVWMKLLQPSWKAVWQLKKLHIKFPYNPVIHGQNLVNGTEIPIYSLLPNTYITSLIINNPHWSGAFITIDGPTLTWHYHSESIVWIRVSSWCCTFCGFGQIYNNMYPPSEYYTK